jgi:hypothetical protein
MRTVRRTIVLDLNLKKRKILEAIARAYRSEKQHWLDVFARQDKRPHIKNARLVRDAAVAAHYQPVSGLQDRMWKLALADAADTWDRYWSALIEKVQRKTFGRWQAEPALLHYANWLMSGYPQFFACLAGKAPAPTFKVSAERLAPVAAFVRRAVSRVRGKLPRARLARSFPLDANCYTAFEMVPEEIRKAHQSILSKNRAGQKRAAKDSEQCGSVQTYTDLPLPALLQGSTQAIAIMTMTPRERVVLPLTGHLPIGGNIRVVLQPDRVEIHVPQALQSKPGSGNGLIEALDLGYTEAFMDTQGKGYGTGLGSVLTNASEERHSSGRSRNKLRAVMAAHRASPDPVRRRKAAHIRRYNLGNKKWDRREARVKATLAREINTGLNTLLRERKPAVVVTEDLRHPFTFNKPKSVNRRLSGWVKGVVQDRIVFKASSESFAHEQVNPAYSSQKCPCCGYVDGKNRSGDRFVCLHCGHADHADRVGALNLLDRRGDPEITRYTPYRTVKTLLDQRFLRRLESIGRTSPETVPGRTLETEPAPPRRCRASAHVAGTEGRPRHKPLPKIPVGPSKSETKSNVIKR